MSAAATEIRTSVPHLDDPAARRSRAIVELRGELDFACVEELAAALASAARADEIVLDLSETTFVDCSSLGVILRGRDEAVRNGSRVVIVKSRALERLVDHLGGWGALGARGALAR